MAKKALCVGINDYPYDGSDLNGCVNDARAWARVLKEIYGFDDIAMLLDAEATKARMMAGLKTLLARARAGDVLVFTNSSHGSYKVDTDGDESRYDECLCPYDVADNDIVDDELRELFENLPPDVHLAVILDNCHSGTATRASVAASGAGFRTPDDRRVRFLNPALRGGKVLENPWRADANRPTKHPESAMKEVLLSGCSDKEYSYDANIEGTYHGAMTFYAIKAIRESPDLLTYNRLHKRIISLIEDYPQNPQLEGSNANKRRRIFA